MWRKFCSSSEVICRKVKYPINVYQITALSFALISKFVKQELCVKQTADAGHPQTECIPVVEDIILDIMERGPSLRNRGESARLAVSRCVVYQTLHKQQLYPHYIQWVQALQSADTISHLVFCQRLLHQCTEDSAFLSRLLVADECSFTRSDIMNFHNW